MIANTSRGVVSSTTKPRRQGTPKTVASIMKAEQFIVTFYDDMGDEHVDSFVRIGDRYYVSPHGEEWCSQLRPCVSWLEKHVAERISAKEEKREVVLPEKDGVGTMGSRLAEETRKIVERSAI